jgi:hypothetical protein
VFDETVSSNKHKSTEATTNGTAHAGETNPADADEQDKVGAAR